MNALDPAHNPCSSASHNIGDTHVYQPIPFFSSASDIEPPIPPDTDLRNIRWFKLDMVGLLNSDFMQLASPEEFKAAFLLWSKSIHQIPAGSLPNDEAILAKLAGGYDHLRKPWKHIRDMALHGWSLCSDNRLYHQAVAGTVLDILASVRVPTAVTAPQSAMEIAKKNGAERQRRFREKQRNAQATVTSPVTPVTPAVTLPVTPVTLPVTEDKDRDKDRDKEVTLRITHTWLL